MRLVPLAQATDAERRQAYPVDQALERVCQVLLDRQFLEGLDELRAGLLLDRDSQVLERIEHGEWLLLKASAEQGDWPVAAAVFNQTVLDLMNNPPQQPGRTPRIYRLVDSMTGEPLLAQPYIATIDGTPMQRRTDAQGIAHLFADDGVRQISVKIFNA